MRRWYQVLITRLKREPYLLLIIGLGLCAIVAVVGAFILLLRSHTADFDLEVGKWLLTVAAALVFSGALTVGVKEIDQRSSKRQAWHSVLSDLGAVNHTVGMVRLYLAAERSVLTYQAQLVQIVRARLELQRISSVQIVMADTPLREHIDGMSGYLEALGGECEKGYLRVTRQQRLDEVWLTYQMDQMKAASDGADAPVLPDGLAEPTKAWDMLMDKARFPRFAALLDPYAFEIDTFRIHYRLAERLLEINTGFGDRSTDAWAFLAPKLAERATNFIVRHKDDLPAKDRERFEEAVSRVEVARKSGSAGEIEEATVALCKANWEAISCVFRSSQRNGAAGGAAAAGV
jgi:hypothetical protein